MICILRGGKLELHNPQFRRPKIAQSSKSKVFHFASKLCEDCNTSKTQAADIAFEEFHVSLLENLHASELKASECLTQFERGNKKIPDDVFRYFAKLMCGFLADVDGPRPRQIASFALGKTSFNPIMLGIEFGSLNESDTVGSEEHVGSHGGLICEFDPNKAYIRAFQGFQAIGPIRYSFSVRLKWWAQRELSIFFPSLVTLSRSKIEGVE